MPTCPNQHETRASDFCEVCGVELPPDDAAGVPKETCPACHAEHDPAVGIFCEVCGYNFKTGAAVIPPPPPPSATATWEMLIAAPDAPDRIVPLASDTLLIGRKSVRRNIEPDIALDPDDGVSHRHAQLTRAPSGDGYALSDLGSSNGTTLNGVEIPANQSMELKEGDTITLGRWSRLVLRRATQPAPLPESP